jgi:hypothetical protein
MERIYHIRARSHGTGDVLNNGGATVHLQSMDGDPLHLRLRVAYCNPTDVFCKKAGRGTVLGMPAKTMTAYHAETGETYDRIIPAVRAKDQTVIALRDLPGELGRIWRTVHRKMKQPLHEGMHANFEHRLREWLPRS